MKDIRAKKKYIDIYIHKRHKAAERGSNMVQHIVLWTMKEGVDKQQTFRQIKDVFEGFKAQVPGMHSLELYQGRQGYDVCLISTHESWEALEAYQTFPAHLEVKGVIKAVRQDRASCDFEL